MSAKHSRRKSKLIKFLSMLLCVCLMIPAMGANAADDLGSKEAEKKALSEQRGALDAQLASLKADKAQKTEYQATLQQQITVVQEEIAGLENDIKALDERIGVLEVKLAAAREEMDETYQLFYERVIAIYTSGSSQLSTLEVLLNAENLNDFTMKANVLESIDEHDSMIVEKIQGYLAETETDRQELKTSQEQLASTKKERDAQKAELNNYMDQNAQALSELATQETATEQQIDTIKADEAAIQAEISAIIEANRVAAEAEAARQRELANQNQNNGGDNGGGTGGGDYSGGGGGSSGSDGNSGGWQWPLYGTVTQEYGNAGHSGMDISSGGNAAIYAAKSGTVTSVVSGWNSSWGRSGMNSYGNYVIISHDGTYSSLYAHMVTVNVSVGDYVSGGQQIGVEGNTGNSFGRHVHFEVWRNGSRMNPRNVL